MNKKDFFFIISFILIIFIFAGCAQKNNLPKKLDENSIVITDILERKVVLNKVPEKIIAIGPGALRLYCYVGETEKIIGIEQIEIDNPTGRPYFYANPSLAELQVIGSGGPNNSPNAEKIVSINPDVIFSTYSTDLLSADELQLKTGIPVITLSYGNLSTFDSCLYESIKIIGNAIGRENRASDVIEFMMDCKIDLENRTKDIKLSEKPSTYIGALSMKGLHGIESTQANYSLFNAINAYNVVDVIDKTGTYMIDREKLIEWNPDIIFLDLAGIKLVEQDYIKNKQFYHTLSAFKNKNVYSVLPYNFYTTNIDTALCNAYYMGKVLYPHKFYDIEIKEKADEIYEFLLGKSVYSNMEEDFGVIGKVYSTP